MLDHIINNPDLAKYVMSYERGQTIFLEGDDSQDLYALVSGKLDILKGTHKIAEVSEQGAIFGEMSFLLEKARTASVKAATEVKVIRIPREEIPGFLAQFPEVVQEFAKTLARRLDEASRLAFGLKEFCDQLPDAVLLLDKEGNILSVNASAERLYGRESGRLLHQPAETLYENPEEYREFIQEVISRYTVREKILRVKHPTEGIRCVSTSTTVLYDAQHHFQGVLFLGRDVTEVQSLERRYRRVRRWIFPLAILLVLSGAGIFWAYPYFSTGYEVMDTQKMQLQDELALDYRWLAPRLAGPFQAGDTKKTHAILERFFTARKTETGPYTGLVLLNNNKRVVDAYATESAPDGGAVIGSSYAGIAFQGNEERPHRVLTLYREHQNQPMGHKGIEVAFALQEAGTRMGWLVFQMDVAELKDQYHMSADDLTAFQFKDLHDRPGNR
ncbi:MAG: cyclic nucleotide-binding domain-containing protein, partial [Deltaproteobacteria bacterium]|nr:cyclic nucleotide-binding domain-containing protein [Deltaproteobacteria bacterium]